MAVLLLLCCKLHAQISYEATSNYGRLYDITYDATVHDKMYARTLSNHIMVSADNGTTWSVLYSHPINIEEMRWVPGTVNFSFMDAQGISIYNTATNTIVNTYNMPQSNVPGTDDTWIDGYDIYDAAGTTLVINIGFKIGFDNYGKTFYSSDSGATYNEIYYTLDNDNVFINNVAIAPNNAQKIFLSRSLGNLGVNGGLFVSENAGSTWTQKLEGVALDKLSFNPSNPNEILVGTGIYNPNPESIYKSVDGGATWNAVAGITWADGILNHISAIKYNPANANQVTILEENQIITTTDGGTTWNSENFDVRNLSYYAGTNASYNPFNQQQIIISNDFFPQLTTDNGATLNQLHVPFLTTRNVAVMQTLTATHLYYSAQDGYMHRDLSTNTTVPYDILDPNSFTNNNATVAMPDKAFAGRVFVLKGSFTGAALKVSNDYGATTTDILTAFAKTIDNVTSAPSNSNIVYVSLKQDDAFGNFYRIDLTDNSYEEITVPGGDGVVTGVIVNGSNPNDIRVSKLNALYHSIDGGLTWAQISTNGLTANVIWDFEQSPIAVSNFIAGTNSGIFTSQDAGATWENALPDVNVKKVAYSPFNANVAAAAVYTDEGQDATLYITVNGGTSWTHITTQQLDHALAGSADFSFTDNIVTAYLATPDLGIMAYATDLALLGTANPVVKGNNFLMHPNPATNQLEVSVNVNDKITNVSIYSLTGQKIAETSKNIINISGLSNGLYIVSVTTVKGTSTQKLIKQ